MASVQVVSPSEYREARLRLLAKEKEETRMRDALAAERRTLPIVEVTKPYTFTAMCPQKQAPVTLSLSELFAGRRQLIMYHYMFAPEWEAGCPHCALIGDSIARLEHLHSRSTTFIFVSRAPIEKIVAFQKRMGWTETFPWVSSYGSDFNYDMHVTLDENVHQPVEYNFRSKEEHLRDGRTDFTKGEQAGMSVFYRGDGKKIGDEGKLYHTYSTYSRGCEHFANTFNWLDITPLGRQDLESEERGIDARYRDEYSAEELRGIY